MSIHRKELPERKPPINWPFLFVLIGSFLIVLGALIGLIWVTGMWDFLKHWVTKDRLGYISGGLVLVGGLIWAISGTRKY